jgi:fatty acid desaturase
VSVYQPQRWYYRYQHIYAPLLYCLLSFKYRLSDIATFTSRMNGRIRVGPPPLFWWANYFVGKSTFFFFRLVLPYFLSSYSLPYILFLFCVSEILHGYYLALNFQVSHVADGIEFLATTSVVSDEPVPIQEDWAEMQVKTTQDYAHGDPVTTFLSGALNYQVVHHLFPSISQTYYPDLAPIVLQTCKEFGIQYRVLPNFWSAVCSHISYLKQMGSPSSPFIPLPTDAVNGEWATYSSAKTTPTAPTPNPGAPLRRSTRKSGSPHKAA